MVKLTLDPSTAEDWAPQREELAANGGLVLPVDDDVPQFASVQVELRWGGTVRVAVTGQLVQRLGPGRAAVLFDHDAKERLLAVDVGPVQPGGAAQRFETLSKPEKIKLARTGSADARRRILRDPDQSLHPFLLNNPGVTGNEVAGWFRSKLVPRPLIEQIAKRTELASHPQVMEALVHDPRTPLRIALDLLPRLPLDTVRRIAKLGRLRTQIVSAARKRIVG